MRNSNRIFLGAGVTASALAAGAAYWFKARHPIGNHQVPNPAKTVDLDRYLGRWHEIARYDQRFERGCKAASAEYALRPDGRINVINRCRTQNGTLKEARGIASIVDHQSNAKLKVSFFGPFYGNYWILDHGENYDWSIVGEPSGRYLWLLSRLADPGQQAISVLVSRASKLGYDTSMLLFDQP